jgi:hypothetical protein
VNSLLTRVEKPIAARRMRRAKFDLIDRACDEHGARSIAELGGCWRVDGDYLFRAVEHHGIDRAVEVDTHPTEGFKRRAAEHPQVELVEGNFGTPEAAERVGEVDAVVFFDVLLHQVAPDWDEVLAMYAPHTRVFVILNQQWTRGEKTIRLHDLGRDEYLRNVPERDFHLSVVDKLDEIHPVHERPWRDVHHIWQWGITDADLEAKAAELGFSRVFYEDIGRFPGLENFRNRGFIFVRDRPST